MAKIKKPAPIVRTLEERIAERDEEIFRQLSRGVNDATVVAEKIASELTNSLSNAEYRLRWLAGAYQDVYYGWYCEAALKDGLASVLAAAKAEFKSWRPQSSTSPYANAANNEKFDALRQFIERFEALNTEVTA